jgi:hypothetical protein
MYDGNISCDKTLPSCTKMRSMRDKGLDPVAGREWMPKKIRTSKT